MANVELTPETGWDADVELTPESKNVIPTDLKAVPGDFNAGTYGELNPDLVEYYNKISKDPALFGDYFGRTVDEVPSLNDFLTEHYQRSGATEGRKYLKDITPPPGGGDGGEGDGETDFGGYQSRINELLAFKNPIGDESYNLAKDQISYVSRRLSEIEEARNLGKITGTLTSGELKLFDEMETSAVENLKSQVNKETEEVWDRAIADLVNRGVLQGTVGSKILGTIGSDSLQMIAEGVNNIRIAKNTNILTVGEANKNRAMQESLALLGVGQGYAGSALSFDTNKLGLGASSTMGFAGLESQENIAEQNRALQEALAQMGITATRENLNKQLTAQMYGWDLDAKTKLAIAAMGADASKTASQWGAGGNLAIAGAAILTSDWFKNFLKGLGSGSENPQVPYGGEWGA